MAVRNHSVALVAVAIMSLSHVFAAALPPTSLTLRPAPYPFRRVGLWKQPEENADAGCNVLSNSSPPPISTAIPRGGDSQSMKKQLEQVDFSLGEFFEKLASDIAKFFQNLGRDGVVEAPDPEVEEQSLKSKFGAGLSVIGALLVIASVSELALGEAELFGRLDAASLIMAGLGSLLSDAEWVGILNRGVVSLGFLIGMMHILSL